METTIKQIIALMEWQTRVVIETGSKTLYDGKVGDIEGIDLLQREVIEIIPSHNARENYLEIVVE